MYLDGYEEPAAPALPLPVVHSEDLGFADVDPEWRASSGRRWTGW